MGTALLPLVLFTCFAPGDSSLIDSLLRRELEDLASSVQPWQDIRPLHIRLDSGWIRSQRPLSPPWGLTVVRNDTVVLAVGIPSTHPRFATVFRHEFWHAFAYAHWGANYCRRWDEAAAEWWAHRHNPSAALRPGGEKVLALGLNAAPTDRSYFWAPFFLEMPVGQALQAFRTCSHASECLNPQHQEIQP